MCSDMEQRDMAQQRAMAAEIRSRLGYMNRSQAWLQREADVPPSTWRKYFGDEGMKSNIPLVVVQRIASVLGMPTGELVTLAEEQAPRFVPGATRSEQSELDTLLENTRPTKATKAQGKQLPRRRRDAG